MNVVTSFFLRARHWQIFLLFFGVMFITLVTVTSSLPMAPQSREDFGPPHGPLVWISMALWGGCFYGWIWSMGSFLSSMVPPSLRLRKGLFGFSLVYPPVYALVFCELMRYSNPAVSIAIFPFHLLAMVFVLYPLYFVSKSLLLVERGKPVSFYDYAGPFFLIWFFPIGVWYIQPRINQMYVLRGKAEPITGTNTC